MKRRSTYFSCLTALFVSVFFATALYAASEQELVGGAFGNTISIVNASGEETLVWLHEDGSYESKLPDGRSHKGVWSLEGDLICFKVTEPKEDAGRPPVCGSLITNRKPGDQWESMVADGSVVTVTLRKGIVGK